MKESEETDISMNNIENEPADISIYIQGRGLVLKEKSLVAVDAAKEKILAIGAEAEQMAETSPENILILSPLRQGRIVDYLVAVKLFTHLLQKAWGKKPLLRPPVAICVPKGISEVEKRAAEDAIYQAGAKEVLISDIPVEEFVREFPEKMPKLSKKFTTIVGISKEEPERYVREQLACVLCYAKQEGISAGRVEELLGKMI